MPDAEDHGAAPLRDGVATLIDALATRLELATVEIDEARLDWGRQAAYSALAVFCGVLAATLAIALLVVAAPPQQRVHVLAVLIALALAGGLACAWRLRALQRRRGPLLASTLDVLRADAAALRLQD